MTEEHEKPLLFSTESNTSYRSTLQYQYSYFIWSINKCDKDMADSSGLLFLILYWWWLVQVCLISVDITHLQESDLNKGSLLACWCACETLPRLIVLIRSCFFSRQALLWRHPSLEEHYDCLDINFSSTSSLSLSGSFFPKEQETIWFYRYRVILCLCA